MSTLLLFIEVLFLYLLYRRYGIDNAIVITYAIVFFYCNSIVLDILFSDDNKITSSFLVIDGSSLAYNLVAISYFLFLGPYFVLFYYFKSKSIVNGHAKNFKFRNSNIIKIFIYISILIMVLIVVKNSQYTRAELKNEGTFLLTLINWLLLFFWAFVLLIVRDISKRILILYSTALFLYCIFSYEREPIVFLAIALLFKITQKKRLGIKLISIVAFCGFFVLNYFKAFYQIILGGGNIDVFFDYIGEKSISFSGLDPLASFTLLYDYFDNQPHFYYEFDFTYITSFTDQISKYVFNDNSVQSMTKVASGYYVGDAYGLAYSMILESIINLSFLGPIFLALCAKIFYTLLKKNFFYLDRVGDLIFIMFFVSFVRTELIVMFKIYLVPITLFLVLISWYKKVYKHKFSME